MCPHLSLRVLLQGPLVVKQCSEEVPDRSIDKTLSYRESKFIVDFEVKEHGGALSVLLIVLFIT